MILSETLFLDNTCENCNSNEYMEHESGFYVCVNCAVVSNMRHGLAVDYKDLNTKGQKYKRKIVDEKQEEEDQHDFNNIDTNMNTHNNTCANSEYNDSYSSRYTKGEIEQKPLAEILLEYQKIFTNLFKAIFYFQFTKVMENFELNSDLVNRRGDKFNYGIKNKKENLFDFDFCDYSYFNSLNEINGLTLANLFNNKSFLKNLSYEEFYNALKNKNFSYFLQEYNNAKNFNKKNPKDNDIDIYNDKEEEKFNSLREKFFINLIENYTNVFDIAKEKWMIFLKKEYETQTKKRGPKFRKRGLRSRRNTEDEFSYLNPMTNNLKENKREKRSINQELRLRRIKSKNINQVESYKNIKLRNKEKMKKFVEEYDQVLSNLKKSSDYIKQKTGIVINENLTFKNLLNLADLFNVKFNDDSSYEEIIHNFFTTKELNYISLYSEKTFDEDKSNFNSDNILLILYECFNSKINWFNKEYPITIYDFIGIFKSFNLKELQIQELKYLKYNCRENIFNYLQENKHKINITKNSYMDIIKNISYKLNLPEIFLVFTENLLKIFFEEILNQKNLKDITYEASAIALVIFAIKYFYGLNDLPYLLDIKKSYESKDLEFLNDEKEILIEKKLNKFLKIFDKFSTKDKLFKHFEKFPSKLELLENLVSLIIKENQDIFIWHSEEYKKLMTNDYKQKYLNFINKNLFPKLENNSFLRNINELENKIGKFFTEENSFTNKNINKNLNLNLNEPNDIKETKGKTNFNFSANFNKKIKKYTKSNINKVNELNKNHNNKDTENSNIKINKFLKEEIEYYKMLDKKHSNKSNISIPLPCDTLLKYNKMAFKFESVKPPIFEMMIYYLFSKFFNVEVITLRKINKNFDKFVENMKI